MLGIILPLEIVVAQEYIIVPLNVYVHTYIYASMNACIHTYVRTYIHTYIYTYILSHKAKTNTVDFIYILCKFNA